MPIVWGKTLHSAVQGGEISPKLALNAPQAAELRHDTLHLRPAQRADLLSITSRARCSVAVLELLRIASTTTEAI